MITGGCICGSCRYELDQEPGFMFFCHCRDCQQGTGTGHSALMLIDRKSLNLTGETREFATPAKSGKLAARIFCEECGCPLVNKPESMPDKAFLHAGSLDNPSVFAPKKSVFRASAPEWDYVDPNMPTDVTSV